MSGRNRRFTYAVVLPLVLVILVTPYVYKTAPTGATPPKHEYSVRFLGGLFWAPSKPVYMSLSQSEYAGGEVVQRTLEIIGPRMAYWIVLAEVLVGALAGWWLSGLGRTTVDIGSPAVEETAQV